MNAMTDIVKDEAIAAFEARGHTAETMRGVGMVLVDDRFLFAPKTGRWSNIVRKPGQWYSSGGVLDFIARFARPDAEAEGRLKPIRRTAADFGFKPHPQVGRNFTPEERARANASVIARHRSERGVSVAVYSPQEGEPPCRLGIRGANAKAWGLSGGSRIMLTPTVEGGLVLRPAESGERGFKLTGSAAGVSLQVSRASLGPRIARLAPGFRGSCRYETRSDHVLLTLRS